MPSINEIIERVAAVRPDAYDDSTKAAWLIELEGKLYGEVILRHKLTPGKRFKGPVEVCPVCGGFGLDKPEEPEDGKEPEPVKPGYNRMMDFSFCPVCEWTELPKIVETFPGDGDIPLLVEAPYDRLYDLYLMAQVDFYNREYDNYNNSVTAFNAALDDWRQKYHRDHLPLPSGRYKNLF
jgi:hypothetical protein